MSCKNPKNLALRAFDNGIPNYKHALPGSMPGSRRLSLRECLEKVRRDIVTCWNFEGDVRGLLM